MGGGGCVLPSRPANHEATELDANGHVSQHERNRLVVDDGGAHGFALFGVAGGEEGEGWGKA